MKSALKVHQVEMEFLAKREAWEKAVLRVTQVFLEEMDNPDNLELMDTREQKENREEGEKV